MHPEQKGRNKIISIARRFVLIYMISYEMHKKIIRTHKQIHHVSHIQDHFKGINCISIQQQNKIQNMKLNETNELHLNRITKNRIIRNIIK